MKTLKNWTLDHENPDGITLSVEDRHLLHIIVLEDDIWRVWLQKNGETALDRTWLISPPAAPNGETGRPRASRDGFTCPPFTLTETADGITVSGSQLRLHIRRPLQLVWEGLENGDWRPLAADRPTGAYELGRRRDAIAHYLTHDPRDRIYGLGEKAGTVERGGKKYEMRSLDAMGYNAETTDPLYKHWPYYQVRTAAGAHYGVFYDNLDTARFDMGCELDNYHPRYRSYRAEGGDLDYYLIHGASIAAITKRFLHLTGKNTFPPKWSLGYSGSTMSYTDAPDAQQQLQKFIALCREHAIPCDSFQLSSGYTSINGKRYVFNWNRDKIPDPPALARAFRDAGIRLAANIKPCLLHDHPRYSEAATKGLFVQDSDSGAPETSMFWDAEGSHLDFTNPATGAWWRDNVKAQLLDLGIGSTWNDNNEYEIWDGDARCHGFGTPIAIRHIRPLMPLLMMQNSWRAQREHNPHERPYLISRSGCPGLQRYVQTWSGDNRTSWHTLKWNIRMAAGMSLSGMYHIGHDIGGFAVALADFVRGCGIRREVDVVARAFVEAAALADGGEGGLRGAVVEGFGRDGRAVCEVNGDAMSLVGADFAAACVIGEALFRVGGDDVVEQGAVEGGAVGVHLADEGGDVRPAVRVEGDADVFGVVAQDEAQVFAEAGAGVGVFHGDGRVGYVVWDAGDGWRFGIAVPGGLCCCRP